MGLVPDSEADLDGRLYKDDRILEINGVDLKEGTQEEAANIIRVSCLFITTIFPNFPYVEYTVWSSGSHGYFVESNGLVFVN